MTLSIEAQIRKDKRAGSNSLSGMQHRHFALIASIIAELDGKKRVEMAYHFAEALKNSNPRFDRIRFLRACEVATGVAE